MVKLLQSVPVSQLGEVNADAIGFTIGAQANYNFRLKEYATAADAAATYVDWAYDALGRKAAETVYTGSTVSAQTLYVWDGWTLLEEVNGLSGQSMAEYIPGPGYIDDIVASRRDPT